MATYAIIDSKTGKDVEVLEFASGGNAQKYAASLGKNYYAKRVYATRTKDEQGEGSK